MKRFDLAMVRNRDLILGEGSLDESIEKICMNISENSSDWSFVHVSDLHVGSPRSYRFQPAWNENWQTARQQIQEIAPELVLIGGDLTRDGATHTGELNLVLEDLAQLGPECLIIPGNHEVGNKWCLERASGRTCGARESIGSDLRVSMRSNSAAVSRRKPNCAIGLISWKRIHPAQITCG